MVTSTCAYWIDPGARRIAIFGAPTVPRRLTVCAALAQAQYVSACEIGRVQTDAKMLESA
jgi:hypothetical protein